MKKSEFVLFLCVFCFGFFAFFGVEYLIFHEFPGEKHQSARDFQISNSNMVKSSPFTSECEIDIPELLTTENGLSKSVLQQTFYANKPTLAECFDSISNTQFKTSAKSGVNIRLYIHPNGKVISSQLMDIDSTQSAMQTDESNRHFVSCIATKISEWKYPEAKNGNFSSVIYYTKSDEKIMVDF